MSALYKKIDPSLSSRHHRGQKILNKNNMKNKNVKNISGLSGFAPA